MSESATREKVRAQGRCRGEILKSWRSLVVGAMEEERRKKEEKEE